MTLPAGSYSRGVTRLTTETQRHRADRRNGLLCASVSLWLIFLSTELVRSGSRGEADDPEGLAQKVRGDPLGQSIDLPAGGVPGVAGHAGLPGGGTDLQVRLRLRLGPARPQDDLGHVA